MTRCVGASQVQSAEQDNTTVQVTAGGPHVSTPGSGTLQTTQQIIQRQLGCLLLCVDQATATAPTSPELKQLLAQLMAYLNPSIKLRLPAPEPASSGAASVVYQTAQQWQRGDAVALVQTQTATQANTTVQVIGLPPRLTGRLENALVAAVAAAAGSVTNAAYQSIFQVQLGCLWFCMNTVQLQVAAQTTSSIQVLLPPTAGPAGSLVSTVAVARQVIWQLQVGCLFACYRTAQVQQALQHAGALTLSEAPAGPTSAPGSGAPGEGAIPIRLVLPRATADAAAPAGEAGQPRRAPVVDGLAARDTEALLLHSNRTAGTGRRREGHRGAPLHHAPQIGGRHHPRLHIARHTSSHVHSTAIAPEALYE
jgi:hypothetical protein